MNLNILQGSPPIFGGNIQTGCHQGSTDPTPQTEDYNRQQQYNHSQQDESSSRRGQEKGTSHQGLGERQGNCPRVANPMKRRDSIDPMVKRVNFADALRRERKGNIIASKRLQQQQRQQASAAALTIRGVNSEKKQRALAGLIEEHKVNLVHLQETKLTKRLWISNFNSSQTQLKRNGGSISSSSVPGSKPIKALGQAISWLLMTHQGVPIHALSVYVEPGNQAQADKVYAQVSGIIRSLAQRTRFPRIILSGDFNQDRKRYDDLAGAYNLKSALPEGTQTHAKGGALDQLYTNVDICSVNLITLDQKVSDHSAVLAVLQFQKQSNDYVRGKDLPIRTQWRLREAAASKVTVEKLMLRKSIMVEPAAPIINDQVKPQRRVQRWYEAKQITQHKQREGTDVSCKIGDQMDRVTWQQTLKTLEQHHKEGQWKEFHHLVRKLTKLKPGSSPVTGVIVNDQTIMDQQEMEETIAKFYGELYKNSVYTDTDMADQQRHPTNPFNVDELEKAASNTNFNKGLGPDLFDGRIIEQNPTLKERILRELASMLNTGQLPDYLREGRLVALSKKSGTSIVELDDIRPIMVRSHLAKIAEKAIKQRLENKHPHILRTKGAQTGFKAGKSTGINIVRVLRQLHPGKKKRQELPLLLLIDLRKAFDSVDKDKLFAILRARCTNDDERWLVSLIKQLHHGNHAYIGQQRVAMNKGVMQGSVLAPLLFNIYLEEVLLKCPTLGRKYGIGNALAYADDLLAFCKDMEEAQQIIQELDGMGVEYGLLINKAKSQLVSRQGGEPVQGIPHSTQTKYLGLQLRTTRKEQKEAAGEQIERNLQYIAGRLRNVNNDVKEALLESYAKSLLVYFRAPMRAAALWKKKDIKQLEERLYRRIHRVPKDISTAVLMNLTAGGVNSADTVERLAKHLLNQANGNEKLPREWKNEGKKGEGIQRRNKLYIPRALTETILALTRGRTIVYFGHRHFCNLHQQTLDDEHLKACHLVNSVMPNTGLVDKLRYANIHEWEGHEIVQLCAEAALLRSTLNLLTERGEYTVQERAMKEEGMKQGGGVIPQKGDDAREITMTEPVQIKRGRGRPRKQESVMTGIGAITHYYQVKNI